MDIHVISSGTTKFTADTTFAGPAITKALTGGGDVADAITGYTDTERETSDDEYAIVYDDNGTHLWSGPLGYHPPGTVTIRPAVWHVSIWGNHECSDSALYTLLVTEQGHGRYAIRAAWTSPPFTLDADGKVHRDDPDNPALRFTLDQALTIAQARASTIRAGIFTAAEAFANHQAYGCPDA